MCHNKATSYCAWSTAKEVMNGGRCRGCSSAMPSDRGLGLMESCKLTRDIGSQTSGESNLPRSRNGEEEEPYRRRQFYQWWRRRQILLESTKGALQTLLSGSGAGSVAKPGDWIASSITKRDEKRSRSLVLISSDKGNVIFPGSKDETRVNVAPRKRSCLMNCGGGQGFTVKRSTGGFAEEDDLFDMDEGFVEPPSKKAKSGAAPPDVAASEASAPKTVPAAQVSTASSLSKGKDVPSTAAAVTPPSVRLQKEVKSSSSKLDGAVKIAAAARQEVDSLKEELGKLKEKLKEEEASRPAAEAQAAEKDELLPQSSLALLEAADIPVAALDKIPNNSPANSVSMTLAAHQLTRELLDKGKGAMARMHSMIFPKISQDKTLGQLIDAFAVNTKEVIEIFPVPPFVDDSSGALSEEDRIQRMKDRIAQMEKDLRNTYALAAIVRKKGEIAADIERYALTELHKATESLNFIALNCAEENKRIHERVNALTELSSAEEFFGGNTRRLRLSHDFRIGSNKSTISSTSATKP
ncbi:hypothetical protein QYE76_022056 [Lolium multiflorum]|uniref:Uncharacterized protein n=1 Tax=Lolium multiflorum TaxID=4521 RepID=A0AAD8RAQ5_LOLMU|nr:hypothetical protein QYE76_022056 [Lolium multiflorum]